MQDSFVLTCRSCALGPNIMPSQQYIAMKVVHPCSPHWHSSTYSKMMSPGAPSEISTWNGEPNDIPSMRLCEYETWLCENPTRQTILLPFAIHLAQSLAGLYGEKPCPFIAPLERRSSSAVVSTTIRTLQLSFHICNVKLGQARG